MEEINSNQDYAEQPWPCPWISLNATLTETHRTEEVRIILFFQSIVIFRGRIYCDIKKTAMRAFSRTPVSIKIMFWHLPNIILTFRNEADYCTAYIRIKNMTHEVADGVEFPSPVRNYTPNELD